MHVSRLQLQDFRNYERAVVELEPGVTLLIGRNGQGKTNLVEALVVAATGSSHRVSHDAALVRAGHEQAFVRTSLTNGERTIGVDLQIQVKGSNKAQASGHPVRMSELPRYLRTVLFSPEDLALVRGDPGGRRRMLDQLIVQRSPRMGSVMSDLERVLRQRSSLLKSARATRMRPDDLTTLDVWDERLVALGLEVERARASLVAELQPHVAEAYRTVAGDEHVTDIRLVSEVPDDEAAYAEALRAKRREELDRGVSLLGPHRDDLDLDLGGLLARHYASHGESWSYALALRLAAAELIRHDAAGDPVVILDDVFAELDAGRRERLAAAVSSFEQVLITAAVDDDVPDVLAGRRIRIAAGVVVEDSGPTTATIESADEAPVPEPTTGEAS